MPLTTGATLLDYHIRDFPASRPPKEPPPMTYHPNFVHENPFARARYNYRQTHNLMAFQIAHGSLKIITPETPIALGCHVTYPRIDSKYGGYERVSGTVISTPKTPITGRYRIKTARGETYQVTERHLLRYLIAHEPGAASRAAADNGDFACALPAASRRAYG